MTRRVLPICAAALLLLVLGVWAPGGAGAQEPGEICPEPHPLAPADEEAIRQRAEAELTRYRTAGLAGWEIVSIEGLDDWGIVTIAPLGADGTSLPGDGDILIAHRERGTWRVALPDSQAFHEWLELVPEELLIPLPERGIYRVALEAAGPSSGVYRLPYACGDRAYVSRAGDDHDNAIDFLIGTVTTGQDWIVAAQDGWVHKIVQDRTACCCRAGYSSNWMILRHANGEYSYYVHLTPYSALVEEGEWVEQGQPIATEGDVGYSCSTSTGTCRTRYCDVPGIWDYCCEHLHFEVRDNGTWAGNRLNPRFEDVPGELVESGYAYYSGNCIEPNPPTPPTNLQPTCGTWHEDGGRRYTNTQTPCFAWDPPEDRGLGFQGYYAAVDDATPDGIAVHANDRWVDDVTAWDVPHPVGEGLRLFAVTAVNQAGRSYSAPYRFFVDTTPPRNPLSVQAGCTDKNNRWQNECYDPAFTWSGASDGGGSGVQDYHFYWGSDEQAVPDTYTTALSFDPGPVAPPDGCSVHFLNLATRDHLGQEGVSGPAFVLRYDGSPPTATLRVDGGAAWTDQLAARLEVTATDGCSGVAEMRLSGNGTQWTGWLPLQQTVAWTLPGQDRRWLPVYVQVRDRAGNVSDVTEDTIYLDLYPEAPHSESYWLCASAVDAGGQHSASTGFSLIGAAGQPWAGAGFSGAGYQGIDGLLGTLGGCPTASPSPIGYMLTHGVMASGGGLKGSSSYREGDTSGQVAGRAAPHTSPSFQLWSGFWPKLTNSIPSTPLAPASVPPQPSLPTPLPSSTAWPTERRFRLQAGESGQGFTNQVTTTLYFEAPNVDQLQIGESPAFGAAGWRPYVHALPWRNASEPGVITGTRVYARFRDGEGTVYGTYESTLFYDGVPPVGGAWVVTTTGASALLALEASDDHSGVYAVRVSADPALDSAPWQAYTDTLSTTWPVEGVVYVQFRDRAGNRSAGVPVRAVYAVYLPLAVGD
jgi:hypothetical protein